MKSTHRSPFVTIPVVIVSFLSVVVVIILSIIDAKSALVGLVGLGFLIFLFVAPLFWLAVFLIVLIPFHALVAHLLGGNETTSRQFFAVWKEMLIFIGLIRALIENSNCMIILKSNRWVLLFAGGLVAVYAITFFRLPSIPAIFSLNMDLRFIAILIFFMLLSFENKQINLLLQLMVLGVGAIALYGVIQYFWDYERLVHLVAIEAELATEESRRLYSFSLSALDPAYGVVIGILILLSIYLRRSVRWLWGLPILLLLVSCLILTYTRSGYLSLIMGAATLFIMDRRHFGRHLVLICAALWLICAVMLLDGDMFLGSNFAKRLDTIVSQKDRSSMVHKIRMEAAVNIIARNPWGIGLGKFGNIQARFEGQDRAEHPENLVLQVGVQTGLMGALMYICLHFVILVSLIRRQVYDLTNNNYLRILAIGVFVAMTVAGIMTPIWNSVLVVFYTWALIGMALRPL